MAWRVQCRPQAGGPHASAEHAELTKLARDFAGASLVLFPQLRDEGSSPQARVGNFSSGSCGDRSAVSWHDAENPRLASFRQVRRAPLPYRPPSPGSAGVSPVLYLRRRRSLIVSCVERSLVTHHLSLATCRRARTVLSLAKGPCPFHRHCALVSRAPSKPAKSCG
jgi:hypothetical protein